MIYHRRWLTQPECDIARKREDGRDGGAFCRAMATVGQREKGKRKEERKTPPPNRLIVNSASRATRITAEQASGPGISGQGFGDVLRHGKEKHLTMGEKHAKRGKWVGAPAPCQWKEGKMVLRWCPPSPACFPEVRPTHTPTFHWSHTYRIRRHHRLGKAWPHTN